MWIRFLLLSVFLSSACQAEAFDPATLKTGDLVFQDTLSSQSAAIRAATKSAYTHVGMVRVYKGNTYVIEAVGPVRVVPFKRFVKQGDKSKVTIVRDESLSDDEREALYKAAKKYKGRPYDFFFSTMNNSIYCSELIWNAYKDAGLEIGKVQKVSELFFDDKDVKALVEARYRKHPACVKTKNKASCMKLIGDDEIMSPQALLEGRKLKVLYSSF